VVGRSSFITRSWVPKIRLRIEDERAGSRDFEVDVRG